MQTRHTHTHAPAQTHAHNTTQRGARPRHTKRRRGTAARATIATRSTLAWSGQHDSTRSAEEQHSEPLQLLNYNYYRTAPLQPQGGSQEKSSSNSNSNREMVWARPPFRAVLGVLPTPFSEPMPNKSRKRQVRDCQVADTSRTSPQRSLSTQHSSSRSASVHARTADAASATAKILARPRR